MILQNQIRCNKCGDEPFSAHTHDYVSCKCGNCAVDGGLSYLRRTGSDYTEMSFSLDDDVVKTCRKAVAWARDTGRNDFGIVCALLRSLHRAGRFTGDT